MGRVVLIGANSGILVELSRLFAGEGAELVLVARNSEKLSALGADLIVRGAKSVQTLPFDAERPNEHQALGDQICSLGGDIDTVVIGHGSLPDQAMCQNSYEATERELRVNLLSPIALCTYFANYFEQRRSGSLTVITSVAGDRGRQSNYIYGAAKGGLSIFLQGLRNRLARANVHVMTVKPGFVDTPMTAHIKKGPLFASAEKVAGTIYQGIKRKSDVLYTPLFWLGIMTIIRNIPEFIFKKMKL